MIARRIIVRGGVQGVGYRDWAVDAARAAGLSGWVRNRRDGTVEAHAEGPADAIAVFVEACREGPPAASVEVVEEVEAAVEGATGFGRVATG